MENDNRPSVGEELTARLGRFVDKLEKAESLSELPKVVTVRRVKLDLRPRPFSAKELQAIRHSLGVSQAIFAEYLGVSISALQDWEQGRHEVTGPVCRLLVEILRDTPAWSQRLKELAKVDEARC